MSSVVVVAAAFNEEQCCRVFSKTVSIPTYNNYFRLFYVCVCGEGGGVHGFIFFRKAYKLRVICS